MWKREITVEVSLGMLTSILKILLNCRNIFIIKYYVKHITPLLEKIKIFAFRQQMKARLRSNITFYQVLIKLKLRLAIAWGKSDDVANNDVIQRKVSLIALKATTKFRLSAWLKQNFLQLELYFSSNRVFPMMTSLNDYITLKFFINVLSINIFIIIKILFLNSQP